MAYRYEVEVTLSSAKDLKNINWRYGPIRPYAVLWVDPNRKVTSRTNDEGDTCPQWNQTLIVPLDRPLEEAKLCIDIVHHAKPDEDIKPLIGSTKLELHDVVDDVGFGARTTRSLKLKRPSGRPHGKLELEIIIRDSQSRGADSYPAPHHVGYSAPPYGGAPPSGYPYQQQHPAYGQAAVYGNPGYGQAAYGYEQPAGYGYYENEKKKSGFGGIGTGLAIGAAAGLVGGVALVEGFDALEDHIADEAAEQVEEDDLGGDDDE